MLVLEIFIFIAAGFLGYLIGRWGHCYLNVWMGNPRWGPHHWVFGLILMVIGLIYYKYLLGLLAVSFGLGHFISDFKDFLKLRIASADEDGEKKFWGFD